MIQFANHFDSKSQSIMFTEDVIVVSNSIGILSEKNLKPNVYWQILLLKHICSVHSISNKQHHHKWKGI